jgi:hypothetical protein
MNDLLNNSDKKLLTALKNSNISIMKLERGVEDTA